MGQVRLDLDLDWVGFEKEVRQLEVGTVPAMRSRKSKKAV